LLLVCSRSSCFWATALCSMLPVFEASLIAACSRISFLRSSDLSLSLSPISSNTSVVFAAPETENNQQATYSDKCRCKPEVFGRCEERRSYHFLSSTFCSRIWTMVCCISSFDKVLSSLYSLTSAFVLYQYPLCQVGRSTFV